MSLLLAPCLPSSNMLGGHLTWGKQTDRGYLLLLLLLWCADAAPASRLPLTGSDRLLFSPPLVSFPLLIGHTPQRFPPGWSALSSLSPWQKYSRSLRRKPRRSLRLASYMAAVYTERQYMYSSHVYETPCSTDAERIMYTMFVYSILVKGKKKEEAPQKQTEQWLCLFAFNVSLSVGVEMQLSTN